MTNMSKQELIKAVKPRYLKSRKKEKTVVLNEFCRNAGYSRKYAIEILQAKCDYRRVARIGRKPRALIYDSGVLAAVIKIWELLEYPCGARLQPMLIPTLEALARCRELSVSDDIRDKLKAISAKTIDRRLAKERELRRLKRNRGTTRRGSLLKSAIPVRITDWDTGEIGFMEMDTVAHNGGDPSGEHIYSLDMAEIFSGWSEQIAVMGKGERGVVSAVNEIKSVVPFKLQGLDSDGGSEFINWHMARYCEKAGLFFTRSRPDRKNDNAYVEQKNYTHIRQRLGYGRYDTAEQLRMINDLYRQELRLFNNFFRPVMKILLKEKINNSVCRKKYDQAKTPYQRLMESDQIGEEQKMKLKELYLSLNPVQLRKAIDEKIEKIKKTQIKQS